MSTTARRRHVASTSPPPGECLRSRTAAHVASTSPHVAAGTPKTPPRSETPQTCKRPFFSLCGRCGLQSAVPAAFWAAPSGRPCMRGQSRQRLCGPWAAPSGRPYMRPKPPLPPSMKLLLAMPVLAASPFPALVASPLELLLAAAFVRGVPEPGSACQLCFDKYFYICIYVYIYIVYWPISRFRIYIYIHIHIHIYIYGTPPPLHFKLRIGILGKTSSQSHINFMSLRLEGFRVWGLGLRL